MKNQTEQSKEVTEPTARCICHNARRTIQNNCPVHHPKAPTQAEPTDCREAFEAWARPRNYDLDTPHSAGACVMENPLNPYGDETTNHCFQAWQAALNTRVKCKPDGDVVAKIKAFKADPTVHDAVHNPADPYSVAWHKREEEHRQALAVLRAQKEVPAEEAAEALCDAYYDHPGWWKATLPMALSGPQMKEKWLGCVKTLSAAGMRVVK
jgi:hypothetical protein